MLKLRVNATLALFLAVSMMAPLALAADPADDSASQNLADKTLPPDELEQRIRDYILQNPEIIVQALQIAQERQRAAQAEQIKAAIAARSEEIFNDPESPVGGNPDGDVTVVEFFDYNCPHCKRVAPVVIKAEQDDPEVRLIYKDLPVLGPDSVFAARAALAARKQSKYVDFHHALMQANGRVTQDRVMEIAQTIGLDTERLKADMEDPAIEAILEHNRRLAGILRITGTPSFVIGDDILRGAPDLQVIKGLVKQAREKDKAG